MSGRWSWRRSGRWSKRDGETGAALLTVLILVGVMGAISVAMFDRLRMATLLAGNAGGLEQARAFGLVSEALITTRIDDLVGRSPGRTTLAGGWQGRDIVLPLPIGTARARVKDGGNCFNLNSLVTGAPPAALASRPIAIEQFRALMVAIEIPEASARRIAASAADWIDSDETPNRDGAEDPVYARAAKPHRTANTMMAEASELRAVNGVTPALYARIRPWVCALPLAELSPINVNTLVPAQAPLIAMLWPDALRIDTARRIIAERPAGGWPAPGEFWNTPALVAIGGLPPGDVLQQTGVRTNWFALDLRVGINDSELHETALIDARRPPSRIASRRWTGDE